MTDPSGQVQLTRRYDPFGGLLSSAGLGQTAYGFTGEEQDQDNGMLFLRSRFYNPGTGRFLSQDTFPGNSAAPQSLHRYTYALNNPQTLTDSSGRCPDGQWFCAQGLYNSMTNKFNQATWGLRNDIKQTAQSLNETEEYVEELGQTLVEETPKYIERKTIELQNDARNATSAWERGDYETAVAQYIVFNIHLTGATDVPILRDIVIGGAEGANNSVQHFNANREVFLDPSASRQEKLTAYGEMAFVGFDWATMGGASELRHGLEEGDAASIALGGASFLPGVGALGKLRTGIEMTGGAYSMYQGYQTGNKTQMAFGALEMLSGGADLMGGGGKVGRAGESMADVTGGRNKLSPGAEANITPGRTRSSARQSLDETPSSGTVKQMMTETAPHSPKKQQRVEQPQAKADNAAAGAGRSADGRGISNSSSADIDEYPVFSSIKEEGKPSKGNKGTSDGAADGTTNR